MAKLYFYYSAMNAGKSTTLLQSSYNYQERGMATILFTPAIDTRYSRNSIHSRIGLSAEAITFTTETNLFDYVQACMPGLKKLACVLVDEAQFLSKQQVHQLTEITDRLNIPVLAYGLRSDFQGEVFPGSLYLLAWAEEIIEIKTICYCGRKATMNMRIDEQGRTVTEGNQIEIGGNDRYIATCRKCFKKASPPQELFTPIILNENEPADVG
ncbi:MAG: thymidine kinase [Legionellales bacterium]|nr:thymidine kinase [Legionellales bacterium]